VIYARHSNPLTGVVEYQLSNIRRAEPSAHLFQIPEDYTKVGTDSNRPWIELKYAEAPQNQENSKKVAPNRRR
jgi:hypothetical protein